MGRSYDYDYISTRSFDSIIRISCLLTIFYLYKLGWLPVIYQPAEEMRGVTMWDEFKSLILPAISLSVPVIASLMRYMRSELIEVLNTDYILLARAKGVNKSTSYCASCTA